MTSPEEELPLLADFYGGAGGTSVGYARAGFRVVGIDLSPQKHYPYKFIQHDAIDLMDSWLRGENNYGYELSDFAAWTASPPCEDHTVSRNMTKTDHGTGWLLDATRQRFMRSGLPWVIENVKGAPLRPDYVVCGCTVGLLRVKRERWFETSWRGYNLRAPCYHPVKPIPVMGHGVPSSYRAKYGTVTIADRRKAMGIDWMNRDELALAIPPAYTELVGADLMNVVRGLPA